MANQEHGNEARARTSSEARTGLSNEDPGAQIQPMLTSHAALCHVHKDPESIYKWTMEILLFLL